jgi:homoserine kinase type II
MAVYTDVSDAELTSFISEYDVGQVVSCKGIAEGVENSNFLVATDRGVSYILTLYERRVNPEDLPYFIALMEHLASKGFSCPTPIPGHDGRSLRRLCGRPAALISFLKGLWPRTLEPFHCAAVGDAVAHLHEASRDFALMRPNALSISGWGELLRAIGSRAEEIEVGLADELAAEYELLVRCWPTELPTGTCHADLFPDNVFFHDRKVSGIIDFYFACTDALAYDLAICVNAWCFTPDHLWAAERGRLMLDAYQRVRPLTPAERQAFPVLARGAALRFLLTRLYDWLNRPAGALVNPKDPREYLRKLRFHRTISGFEAYGL